MKLLLWPYYAIKAIVKWLGDYYGGKVVYLKEDDKEKGKEGVDKNEGS